MQEIKKLTEENKERENDDGGRKHFLHEIFVSRTKKMKSFLFKKHVKSDIYDKNNEIMDSFSSTFHF